MLDRPIAEVIAKIQAGDNPPVAATKVRTDVARPESNPSPITAPTDDDEAIERKVISEKAFDVFGAFNPTSDALTQAFGWATTGVLTRIWRFSQMSSGTCYCRHQRLADDLALTNRTVRSAIKTLIKFGLIEEVNGEWKQGQAKTYVTTNKVTEMVTQLRELIKARRAERGKRDERPLWGKGELLALWNERYNTDF